MNTLFVANKWLKREAAALWAAADARTNRYYIVAPIPTGDAMG